MPTADAPERRATVRQRWEGDPTIKQVEQYLPSNYSVQEDEDGMTIIGHDSAGWTLDGYVIPRLASGLITAEEVVD